MSLPAGERITLVEVLELKGSYETFLAIIRAAARRLEAEGVRGLVGARFYAKPESREIGAVITFAGPGQVMEHIRMISGWPEFKALLACVVPIDVRVYGRLPGEAHAWLRQMNVESRTFEHFVAGFER
ncbi:hypothetical protein [Pyxidicoccus xibeiensis]|uniref:hypothetical protein n=1 Tax=Pyxidicoccus xibeiensis TaxID=2906759 RepID=UPI0020A7D99B|nr:hypothetical protein [Pyxidicoccus xibeiensis]MCP3145356.1 hypothetical protein [Pyxidicoccus xibeiensis]